MNRVLCFVFALICTIVPYSGFCQKQTQKAIEQVIQTGQYKVMLVRESWKASDYMNPSEVCSFTVSNCDIEQSDFNAFFKQNPQYVVEGLVSTETRAKYRQLTTYVKSFSFRTNHKMVNAFEFEICVANKNPKLTLPSFNNFREAEDFYQKYVKRFPQLATKYKQQFNEKFGNHIKTNPEAMKRFCDGSPYQNDELLNLKKLDVWSLLQQCSKRYDYVFYLASNNGYYYDKNGDFEYSGDIRDGLPNGKGNNKGWEGTFKDGKKVGFFTYTEKKHSYKSYSGEFDVVYKGTCVDDQWDGEVVKTVTPIKVWSRLIQMEFTIKCNCSDVEKLYYSQGQLVRDEMVSDCVSTCIDNKMEEITERHFALKEQSEREYADRERTRSSVNEDNIMNYVRKIDVYKDDVSCSHYDVDFKDGKRGSIYYDKHRGQWSWCDNPGSIFATYLNAKPNSKNGALACLYKALLK